jgi:acetyl esterase/lipase
MRRYRGMTHGFVRLQNFVEVARTAMDDIATAMRAATGRKA